MAIAVADFEGALALTGAATPYSAADDRPLFDYAEPVFLAADFPAGASANGDYKKVQYTVDAVVMKLGDDSGTKILDQLNLATSPADSVTARAVPGWQHTTAPGATQGATTVSAPWFYDIIDANGKLVRRVHEAQLTDLASIKTYVAADVATGWV